MKLKSLSICFLLIFLSLIPLTSPLFVSSNPSWLTGWDYRKSHVINYATGSGTNYQIKITVHYGSGTDGDDDVYLNSHCRTDFGDVRFTDNDETTLLEYFMISKTNSDNAVFWVKVKDSLSSQAVTIYIYYGKSDATTSSNIQKASWNLAGDDFNDNSRNTTLWDTILINGGLINETNQHLEYTCGASGRSAGYESVGNNIFTNVTIQLLVHHHIISENGIFLVLTKTTTDPGLEANWYRLILSNNDDKYYVQRKVSGSLTTVYSGAWSASENNLTIQISGTTIKFFEGSTQRASETWALSSQTCYLYIYGRSGAPAEVGTDWADLLWIRKYVATEPTHGAWGNEETPPASPTNDACDSTTTFPLNLYAWVNMTVSDPQLVADLKTVDIQVNTTGDAQTFTLRWTQATNVFSEVSDTSGICVLDDSISVRVNIDADTDKIAFYFKITGGTFGQCDVKATSIDDSDHTDINMYSNEFIFANFVWTLAESWTGALLVGVTQWNFVESWTGSIFVGVTNWRIVETWLSSINSYVIDWSFVESWIGSINPRELGWMLVEFWIGNFVKLPSERIFLFDLPTMLSAVIGGSVFASGLLLTLLAVLAVTLPCIVFTKSKNLSCVLAFIVMAFAVYLGWFNIWIAIIIGLLFILFYWKVLT